MRKVLVVIALLFAILAVVLVLTARTHTPPFRDPDGTPIEGSIAEERRVMLGGHQQYVLIRGRDRAAPILLFLHGGPGTTEMPMLRVLNAALEDDFVFVNWDQRGTGKSYSSRLDPATLTVERMIHDLDALVDLLRAEFGQERILLVCHSWGTQLGLEYASQHPEKVAAYVGVGQITDAAKSDALGTDWALAKAKAREDSKAVKAIEALGAPPYSLEHLKVQRKYVWDYGGSFYGGASLLDAVRTALEAPEVSWFDAIAMLRGGALSLNALWNDMREFNAFEAYPRLDVPVFILHGRHDRQVSAKLAADYFERLEASHKELIWFEESAHAPPFEEPERFNAEIKRIALEIGLLISGN